MIIKREVKLHIDAFAEVWIDESEYPNPEDAAAMIKGITLAELVDKVTSCDIHPYLVIQHNYPSTDDERKSEKE